MRVCRICGKPVSRNSRYCKEKCEGELECASCGELKDSLEFHDYRDSGGSFKSSCKKCLLRRAMKKYKHKPLKTRTCSICGCAFETARKSWICGKPECRRIMARLQSRYEMKRRK